MSASAPERRPLRRDARENLARMTAAGREVFAQRGFDATLDEVAEHAGLGVATVYRRFPNKAALIEALFDESLAQFEAIVAAALEEPDAWDGFVAAVTGIAGLHAADRSLRRLMFSGDGGVRAERLRARLRPSVEQLVERAQREGGLRADFALSDLGPLQLMIVHVGEFTQAADPQLWRRYLAILLDGLRTGQPSPLPRPALGEAEIEMLISESRP